MTTDIKDIIKWFIPCFHILLRQNSSRKYTFVCLFLFFNLVASSRINSELGLSDKLGENLDSIKSFNVSSVSVDKNGNQSVGFKEEMVEVEKPKSLGDRSIGRTFGRPFKKMMAGLLPVIFQVGAASTWAVVAALVGVKTLLVALAILKLMLIAGAAKIGALFAEKGQHHHHGWEPPHQKEIHLHIHNGSHDHEHHDEHLSAWSREGFTTADPKPVYVYEPYNAGPQTISTPYGNYMKIDSGSLRPLGPVTVST